MESAARLPVFPLVRHLSRRATPLLARLPLTANQITALSLAAGLAAAWALTRGDRAGALAAGLLMVACYVLDNCDGEIARLKGQSSTFGMWFDTFVDWIVHTVFFVALGIGIAHAFGQDMWLWMGLVAGAGGTFNFFLGLFIDARERKAGAAPEDRTYREPEGLSDWVIYAFRELTRADFCFIVLALAVFDWTWVLLPAGAVGSQVYWITQLVKGARDFHV